MFKAKLASESYGKDLDDQWVEAVFVIMYEFKELNMDIIRNMSAFTFMILLEELRKKSEREEAEMKKSNKGGTLK